MVGGREVGRGHEAVFDDVSFLRQGGIGEHDGVGGVVYACVQCCDAIGLWKVVAVWGPADVDRVVAVAAGAGFECVACVFVVFEFDKDRAGFYDAEGEIFGEGACLGIEFVVERFSFSVPALKAASGFGDIGRGTDVASVVFVGKHGIREVELAKVVNAFHTACFLLRAT